MSDIAAAAVAYASRGWAVIPIHGIDDGACTCKEGAECKSPGKHPLWPRWQERASSDPNTVAGWWSHFTAQGQQRNIGIVCGPSGLVVIDVDGEEGEATLRSMPEISSTLTVRTRRGRHLYFRDDVPAGKLEGLDIKAGNGFVVAPPSIRIDGGRYEWA